MNKRLLAPIALLALLLTGCPRNEYIVELKPHGNAIERTLTYYRVDLGESNNVNGYQPFPTVEMGEINSLYPAGGVTNDGDRHTVHGTFANALPNDVGGVGAYTNVDTSLGSASFYVERFRGNDDLAGIAEKQRKAADRLTDLILGWSKSELGSQPGYGQLAQFLNTDFRRDLKNLGAYWWQGNFTAGYSTNGAEEFMVRFGQYLVERGYLQIADMPALFRSATDKDDSQLGLLLQRLVARKMGVPDSQPLPACLAFLADDDTISKSFENYLTNTDSYRASLKQWEEDKKTNPDLQKPDPTADDGRDLVDFNLFGNPDDRLTVRLMLPIAPTHSNGRWDETNQQVIWDTNIVERTNSSRLPVICYANWAEPAASFQKTHFGKVALTGNELTEYCLWRTSLDEKQAGEWDALLVSLQPGDQLTNVINNFRFSGEPHSSATNNITSPSAFTRELITDGLK
ncbi:MAG TPA: hypothetical protein VN048_14700 [Verrucomicrobiae bacterium]|jgi:hypothetical protein|nr:hypothetical protein [Verrucomicrobiae bacterium]